MISAWFSRVALIGVVASPATAGAAANDVGTFGYRAPAECPSRVEFSAQVAARTSGWLSPSSPFAVTVSIDRGASGVLGRVTFARGEQRTERELQAGGGNELGQAPAFISARLIVPQAPTTALPATDQARPPPVYLLPAEARAPAPVAARLWFIAGPEIALQTALTGDAAVAEHLFFGLGRGAHSLAMSSARLTFGRVASHASNPSGSERAEFELITARLDGCLLRATDRTLAFETCPFVEFGRLQAVGLHRGGNVTRNEPWGAVGLVLRPSWTFSQRLVLGASLGLQLPLRHYHFAFTGAPELTRTPDLGFEASLGLGVRFP